LVGPVVTALLGGLIIGLIAAKIARNAEGRRSDHRLREEMISQVTEAAASLYYTTQRYWRARSIDQLPADQLKPPRAELDAQYHKSRVAGEVAESRLRAYYLSDKPESLCHRVFDLLTVRYFDLIDKATDRFLEINAGEQHSGLSVEELRQREKVLSAYHRALDDLVNAMLTEPLGVGLARPKREPATAQPPASQIRGKGPAVNASAVGRAE
jgi:hypothetical protein